MAKKVAKKASKKKTGAKKVSEKIAKAVGSGDRVPLKKVCQELKIDPKRARVKLRKAIASGDITFHEPSARWELTPAQVKIAKEVLRPSA